MKLLAIDSATERLALAAIDDGRAPGAALARAACRIEPLDLDGGAAASAQALPMLIALLQRAGWAFADLDAIAFGRGPGGFTGLRTACAVAQGLAFGQDVPVVPVDSLAIVAEDAARRLGLAAGAVVWVTMDARMDEIYAGCYRDDGAAGWRAVVEPALTAPDALHAQWRAAPPAVVAGSALSAFGERLDTGAAQRVSIEQGRAAALGWLAAAGFARGDAVPADQALPIYLRDKVAQTTAERAAAKAARESAAGAPR
ncbi:MAG: tRNA (adenosine(37)-N6)-threonylcarbamoyltransferase complex dimerization subunit type 1 TsaB [Burkholderiales bacterium]|nr:tRNA (adenosine(37)-N6)-threonylcarbamoyltransferase complex dimerization subunit type 1 TsaB [Burkholderiales bacterium]